MLASKLTKHKQQLPSTSTTLVSGIYAYDDDDDDDAGNAANYVEKHFFGESCIYFAFTYSTVDETIAKRRYKFISKAHVNKAATTHFRPIDRKNLA
jgi:hypothetical protein